MSTFILVHGAWCGGWAWKRVKAHLEDQKHTVYTPTLTGLGERSHLASRDIGLDTHITDIVNTILWEDLTDVILAGHSYGGAVITGVAARRPDLIRKLVYVDAYTLEENESIFDKWGKVPEGSGDGFLPGTGLGKNVEDPIIAEWINSKSTPHPIKTGADKLKIEDEVSYDIPRAYIMFLPHKPGGRTNVTKDTPGWDYYEIETNHFGIITDAAKVADLLLKIQG